MKERPILFSTEMVQAIQADKKSQTRRVAKLPLMVHLKRDVRGDGPFWMTQAKSGLHVAQINDYGAISVQATNEQWLGVRPDEFDFVCPYGRPGDRLWVRETWQRTNPGGDEGIFIYKADGKTPWGFPYDGNEVWRPSIFMPRGACRLHLEITKVRVQRLQKITAGDAAAEGLCTWTKDGQLFKWGVGRRHVSGEFDATEPWQDLAHDPVTAYRRLWDKINSGRGFCWDLNHLVWVIEFVRVAESEVSPC